jgi:hypothetical protein
MADTDTTEHPEQDDAAQDRQADATILVYQSPLQRIQGDTANLLDIARGQHAFDPTVFDDHPPFFWRTVPSTQLIDAYGTRMMDDSLKNFAADANEGVSFMAAHDVRDMPLGRSVVGEFKDGRVKGGKRTEADFYTVPGLKTRTYSSDDFVLGTRAGINHDVSIGFYGGEIRCSVCNERWWSFFGMTFNDCDHMPGMTYQKLDAKGKETDQEVIASGDVYGAHMAETSAVYDGATPGAAIIGILRAERMVDAGRVAPDTARLLEARYRVKLPVQHNWQGADLSRAAESRAQSRHGAATTPPSEEERAMANRNSGETNPPEQTAAGENNAAAGNNNPPADASNSSAGSNNAAAAATNDAAVAEAEQRGRTAAQTSFRTLLVDCQLVESSDTRDIATVVRSLADSNQQLRDQAADGRQYREDLVVDALAEGIRALGNDFRKDDYEPLLRGAPISTIKRFRDDWKKVGDEKLAGGRHTQDGAADGSNGTTKVEFTPPASVHRG